jgi:hypothetical protein
MFMVEVMVMGPVLIMIVNKVSAVITCCYPYYYNMLDTISAMSVIIMIGFILYFRNITNTNKDPYESQKQSNYEHPN